MNDTQARDLRLLDALPASSPPAILCRDRAIVVNLEFIKCIITTGAERYTRALGEPRVTSMTLSALRAPFFQLSQAIQRLAQQTSNLLDLLQATLCCWILESRRWHHSLRSCSGGCGYGPNRSSLPPPAGSPLLELPLHQASDLHGLNECLAVAQSVGAQASPRLAIYVKPCNYSRVFVFNKFKEFYYQVCFIVARVFFT